MPSSVGTTLGEHPTAAAIALGRCTEPEASKRLYCRPFALARGGRGRGGERDERPRCGLGGQFARADINPSKGFDGPSACSLPTSRRGGGHRGQSSRGARGVGKQIECPHRGRAARRAVFRGGSFGAERGRGSAVSRRRSWWWEPCRRRRSTWRCNPMPRCSVRPAAARPTQLRARSPPRCSAPAPCAAARRGIEQRSIHSHHSPAWTQLVRVVELGSRLSAPHGGRAGGQSCRTGSVPHCNTPAGHREGEHDAGGRSSSAPTHDSNGLVTLCNFLTTLYS